jgi:hypothetical protein
MAVHWKPFDTAPRDREIMVTRNLGRRPLKQSGPLFKWDNEHECWLQKVGVDWHRQFFDPTHWREPPK